MVIRRVTAPVMPQASETARPSGAAFGNSAEVTSSPSANPKRTVSQIGIPLTAENARREKFAPSTPRSRPGCAVPSCSAPPGRLPAGGSLALENEPLPRPAACGHTLALRDSPISPGVCALDDHEPRVGDRPATRERPCHDPVRAGREGMASDPASEPNLVDAGVALDAEPPDAATVRCNLDDDELDDRSAAQHEDERRPSLLVRLRLREIQSRASRSQRHAKSNSLRPAGSDWRCRSPERRRPAHQRWSVPPYLRRCCSTHLRRLRVADDQATSRRGRLAPAESAAAAARAAAR